MNRSISSSIFYFLYEQKKFLIFGLDKIDIWDFNGQFVHKYENGGNKNVLEFKSILQVVKTMLVNVCFVQTPISPFWFITTRIKIVSVCEWIHV